MVVTWRALNHPNLLLLLGVTMTDDQLAMISEWMPEGNIMEFTRANPNVDRLGLVRSPLESLISLLTDDPVVAVAERCHQGVDVYARPEDNTWRSQRGMFPNSMITAVHTVYLP